MPYSFFPSSKSIYFTYLTLKRKKKRLYSNPLASELLINHPKQQAALTGPVAAGTDTLTGSTSFPFSFACSHIRASWVPL